MAMKRRFTIAEAVPHLVANSDYDNECIASDNSDLIPKETIQNAKTKSSMEPTSCSVCAGEYCGETQYIYTYYIVPELFCNLSFINILQIRCL